MTFKFKPYTGSEHEIDMFKDWYCPYCSNQLSVNKTHDLLFCPDYQQCEYEHHSKEARKKYQVVWHEGYRYPITKIEVIEKQRAFLICQRKKINKELKENKIQLEKVNKELIN